MDNGTIHEGKAPKAKGGKGALIVVSLISLLCVAGLLFFMFQERAKRIEAEQRLIQVQWAKRAVETRLDQTQSELRQLKDEARVLAAQLEEEKKSYQVAIKKKDGQIKELKHSLADEETKNTNLTNSLAQLRESHDSLDQQTKEARSKIDELKEQLAKLRDRAGVELKKIVVKSKGRPKARKVLNGKVLVVNREFHFLVIDLGKRDGVKAEDKFAVYHDWQEVGQVQIERVYDTLSVANILSGSQEQKIKEDNIVKSFF